MKEQLINNIFGEKVDKDPILRDRFIEPPFSVLDTKSGSWQRRKKLWRNMGIKGEIGRDDGGSRSVPKQKVFAGKELKMATISIFDPALCEVLYHWFCPEGGSILDPFAGGSVRGIVANYLGYNYTGIDIRQEQIESNQEQAVDILKKDNQPLWYVGDSNEVLDTFDKKFDFVFSCPPYADLEVYSDLPGDISNMSYDSFLEIYSEIINKACKLLKPGGYACFVVGEIRGKDGNYVGFVPDTIQAFIDAGMGYYNEAILLNAIGTAMMRANGCMKSGKLVKTHQNILVFRK